MTAKYSRAFAIVALLSIAVMAAAPDHQASLAPGPALTNHGAQAAGHNAAHSRHCHGDAAGCSDVPLAAATGLTMLAAVLAFAGGAWNVVGTAAGAPRLHGRALAVIVPPPRPA